MRNLLWFFFNNELNDWKTFNVFWLNQGLAQLMCNFCTKEFLVAILVIENKRYCTTLAYNLSKRMLRILIMCIWLDLWWYPSLSLPALLAVNWYATRISIQITKLYCKWWQTNWVFKNSLSTLESNKVQGDWYACNISHGNYIIQYMI